MRERIRLTCDLHPDDRKRLEDLTKLMHASSDTETIRRLIRFCHRLTEQTKADTPFIYVGGEKTMIPF